MLHFYYWPEIKFQTFHNKWETKGNTWKVNEKSGWYKNTLPRPSTAVNRPGSHAVSTVRVSANTWRMGPRRAGTACTEVPRFWGATESSCLQARQFQSEMLSANTRIFLTPTRGVATSFFPVHQTLVSVHLPDPLPSLLPVHWWVSLHFQRLLFHRGLPFLLSQPGLSPGASIFTSFLVMSFHCSALHSGLGVYSTCTGSGLSKRLKSSSKRGTEVSSLTAGPSRGRASPANLRSPGEFSSGDSTTSLSVMRVRAVWNRVLQGKDGCALWVYSELYKVRTRSTLWTMCYTSNIFLKQYIKGKNSFNTSY